MADARIFADLKADHDRHRALLAKLAETSGASDERKALFDEFRTEVGAHAAAEEESLYATMLGKPDLREDAVHSVSEHKEISDMLGELADIDMSSSAWMAKFKELRHEYEHHIDEEEEEMFPAASDGLSNAEEAKLAKIFEDRKPKELERAEANPPGSDERE
ncbi:hemerythrin domain-containing protein [Sphingomonas donggukensis]|uniref:Hemerythrin domain-containing protein n=1 Tax=Sphingomonas donggukensis TaxID=2949093 RepID=A0ABY4TXJ9_9SPHN|nr:hemerythrin domain-containing protein [Sphingomonas donggukensis]URW75028.1 hemerythrin domain-containing protein [Sphingomonas donggukensis]